MIKAGVDIVNSIIEGKESEALQYLYKTVLPKIRKYILNNSGDEDEVRDIFQDSVIAFWDKVKKGEFNTDYEPENFIFITARNLWINRAKKKNKHVSMPEYTPETDGFIESSHVENLLNQEKVDIIDQLMDQIGDDCKKLLKLSTWEGLSMKQICIKMGLSNEDVAKTYNYRCKQKLINLVKKNKEVMRLFNDGE